MDDDFGTLKRINLREIWNNEYSAFTPWLADHIDELGKALGIELVLKQKEAPVGDFSLDILATDVGRNRLVIIENQLTATNHDHLGKILTYSSGFDASTIIWIAESIRDEHRQTLEWLNQKTDEDTEFFAVVIEVLKIDDSKPVFNFRPVVFPNEWRKATKKIPPGQTSEKMEMYRNYFQQLIDDLREKYNFTNARKGQPQSWYSFSSGIKGLIYGVSFALGGKVRVDTYIDLGEYDKNKALFDLLYEEKEKIEEKYDDDLV